LTCLREYGIVYISRRKGTLKPQGGGPPFLFMFNDMFYINEIVKKLSRYFFIER
jgi:hypothetical protein